MRLACVDRVIKKKEEKKKLVCGCFETEIKTIVNNQNLLLSHVPFEQELKLKRGESLMLFKARKYLIETPLTVQSLLSKRVEQETQSKSYMIEIRNKSRRHNK